MKRIYLLILLLCLCGPTAFGAIYSPADSTAFNEGLQFLKTGDNTKAVIAFSSKQYSHNGTALINLGIAYNSLEETILAVGSFRRARSFSDLFSESSKQASLWLDQLGYSSYFFADYRSFLFDASRISWRIFYCLFFVLILLIFNALYRAKKVILFLSGLLLLFSLSLNKIYFNQQIFGTLIGQNIELYSGPSSQSSVISEALPGDYIRVLSQKENWFAIELSEERQGWLSKDFIIFH